MQGEIKWRARHFVKRILYDDLVPLVASETRPGANFRVDDVGNKFGGEPAQQCGSMTLSPGKAT
jgi:hypothetical protein